MTSTTGNRGENLHILCTTAVTKTPLDATVVEGTHTTGWIEMARLGLPLSRTHYQMVTGPKSILNKATAPLMTLVITLDDEA